MGDSTTYDAFFHVCEKGEISECEQFLISRTQRTRGLLSGKRRHSSSEQLFCATSLDTASRVDAGHTNNDHNNIADFDIDAYDEHGRTMLFRACLHRKTELCELLLQYGARADCLCQISMRTPLMIACDDGYSDIVELLLKHGADPNRSDRYNDDGVKGVGRGWTLNERMDEYTAIALLLLQNGADPWRLAELLPDHLRMQANVLQPQNLSLGRMQQTIRWDVEHMTDAIETAEENETNARDDSPAMDAAAESEWRDTLYSFIRRRMYIPTVSRKCQRAAISATFEQMMACAAFLSCRSSGKSWDRKRKTSMLITL